MRTIHYPDVNSWKNQIVLPMHTRISRIIQYKDFAISKMPQAYSLKQLINQKEDTHSRPRQRTPWRGKLIPKINVNLSSTFALPFDRNRLKGSLY